MPEFRASEQHRRSQARPQRLDTQQPSGCRLKAAGCRAGRRGACVRSRGEDDRNRRVASGHQSGLRAVKSLQSVAHADGEKQREDALKPAPSDYSDSEGACRTACVLPKAPGHLHHPHQKQSTAALPARAQYPIWPRLRVQGHARTPAPSRVCITPLPRIPPPYRCAALAFFARFFLACFELVVGAAGRAAEAAPASTPNTSSLRKLTVSGSVLL